MIELWRIALILSGTIIGAFGALLLKLGSRNFVLNFKKLITNYKLFIGLFLYVVSTIPFIIAIKNAQLSILYPIVSAVYIWVALLSIKFLNEKMNKFKWAGIFTIILGIIIITFA